ncbi:MAG: aminotransferase, partial [Flavobacterium sp.]
IYMSELQDRFIKPLTDELYDHVYHIFNIRHPERDQIQAYLQEQGIGTEIHYPIPPHKQKALKSMNNLDFPISSEIHATTLSLPCSFAHSENDIRKVVQILNAYY